MPNKKEKELRFFKGQQMRVVDTEGQPTELHGYAALFEQLSVNFGGWREMIMPGAFTETLSSDPDVRALVNHQGGLNTIGRTVNDTLKLEEDSIGLRVVIQPPDTQAGRDVTELVRRGDLSQMSFAFWVVRQNWRNLDDYVLRELLEVDLSDGDVAVVTYPAYPQTDIHTRDLMNLPQIPEDLNRFGQVSGLDNADVDAQVSISSRRRKLQLLELE